MTGPIATPSRRRIRWFFRQTEHVFALFGLGTMVFWICFDLGRVVSPSMSPSLKGTKWKNGDLVVSERVSYCVRAPRRWEVIAFHGPDGATVMKRVVAMPGEQIELDRDGTIRVDGHVLERPSSLAAIKFLRLGNLADGKPVVCNGGYYVLGDDSADSDDSRFNGLVSPGDIIGRAWLILKPIERFGFVNP